MCARERLPVECLDVHEGGVGRAIRGTAVGTRERLPVDLEGGRLGIEEKHILRWLSGQQRTVHRSRRRMK